jgi:hypothetical protein
MDGYKPSGFLVGKTRPLAKHGGTGLRRHHFAEGI